MDTKTTLSITDARKDIFKITKEVQKPGIVYTLTDNGRPKAVIMSAEYFESLIETIEVLQIFPNLEKDIKQAEENLKTGRTIDLDDYLAEEGYIINQPPKKNVSGQNRTKSGKKSKKITAKK